MILAASPPRLFSLEINGRFRLTTAEAVASLRSTGVGRLHDRLKVGAVHAGDGTVFPAMIIACDAKARHKTVSSCRAPYCTWPAPPDFVIPQHRLNPEAPSGRSRGMQHFEHSDDLACFATREFLAP